MKEFRFKAANIIFVLIGIAFLPSLTFAAGEETIYHAKLGCMACHQGEEESMQPDQVVTESKSDATGSSHSN